MLKVFYNKNVMHLKIDKHLLPSLFTSKQQQTSYEQFFLSSTKETKQPSRKDISQNDKRLHAF